MSEWIDITKTKPYNEQWILCFLEDGYMSVLQFDMTGETDLRCAVMAPLPYYEIVPFFTPPRVTHWMPLPAPPKEETK